MKVFRIIAIAAFAFFAFLAPTAANAAPGDYTGNPGGVVVTPPTQDGNCVVTSVTLTSPIEGNVTLTVKNSSGTVVFQETKPSGSDGKATFTVRVCGTGTFTATGTGPNGGVLGTSQFTGVSGSQGGGNSSGSGTSPSSTGTGSNAGGLPNTGSSSSDTLLLGGAAALLLVGGITVAAARRKSL